MYPVLVDFGRFKLHSYGLMMFFAFVLGIWIAHQRGKRSGLAENTVLDLSTLIIIFGLIGGRLLYVLTHLEEFRGRWLDIINPFQSDGRVGFAGLVLLGGVVLGFVAVVVYIRRKRQDLLTVLDVFAPPLALGIGIGRLGCYLNGCCFGLPTTLPWGVVFPRGSSAGYIFPGQHIHPTQLYEFLYGAALFLLLLWAEKQFRTFKGFTWSIFLIGYGLLRFLNELIRWHESGLHLIDFAGGGFLTVSQAISLAMLAAGSILFIFLRRRELGSGGTHAGGNVQAGSMQ